MSAGEENLRRQPDGFTEILGDSSQGGQKQIAEAVAFEAGPFYETMLKQAREQGLVFGERNDAVANISGREHAELLAQAPAVSAIVADGYDGAQLADLWLVGLAWDARAVNVTFETLKQGRQSRAAADGNHAQTAS